MVFLRRRRIPKKEDEGTKIVPEPGPQMRISPNLKDNEEYLRQEFSNTTDIVFRSFYLKNIRCLAVWIDGLINNRVSHDLFRALMLDVELKGVDLTKVPKGELMDYINLNLLPYYSTSRVTDLLELKRWVLMAKMIFLVDGCPVGLMLDAEATPLRSITEPLNESSVSGPRDAFVESLRINTALIRARLGDPRLKSENFILGRRSNTLVTLMYVEDVANKSIVEEVRRRLQRIDIDGMIDSSYLKELIQDEPYPLFPLIKSTERPDKVVADLLEGRFALIVDGSCQVLTAPCLFIEFLQNSEDYYQNIVVAWIVRLFRHLSFFIAATLPGIYVAITTFHQEMIPIPLIFTIAGARETVPFPAFVDALFMLIIFELLWEAGIRMPRVVGAAVNIVGALILGQAAVQAGLVSPVLVIVIAATAIANFVLGSAYELAAGMRLIRIFGLAAGAVLGMYGVVWLVLALMVYLAGLKSFGVPYLAPWMPFRLQEMKDVVYRAPRWAMELRPELIAEGDLVRSRISPPSPSSEHKAKGQ